MSKIKKEKYGFVYIWFDIKHKRYYIGCHWGREDDSYICSSTWMKQAYKHRPLDFKRKILKTNINLKETLLEEEYKWLNLIKKEELGKRYYNVHNHHFNHWSNNTEKLKSISERMKEYNRTRIVSQETRDKMAIASTGRKQSEFSKQVASRTHKGKTISSETKEKCSEANKNRVTVYDTLEKKKLKITKELFDSGQKRYIGVTSGMVTAYDLINKTFVKIDKELFKSNKDRYCGTTSNKINNKNK